jgi:hypothetical protein
MKSSPSGNNTLRKIALSMGMVLLCCAAIIFAFLIVLPRYIEREIEKEVHALHGRTASVEINLFTRSLLVKGLEWGAGTDSLPARQHVIQLHTVTLRRINIAALLMRKVIQVEEVIIDDGKVYYNSHNTPDRKKPDQPAFNILSFKSVSLKNIHLQIKADTLVSFSTMLTGRASGVLIKIDSVNTIVYTVKAIEAQAEQLILSREEGMYGGTIARVRVNTETQRVIVDSILLIPNYSKYAFAKVSDEQTDRVNIAIPQVILEGVQFKELLNQAIIVAKINVKSFDLHAFRDKRVPFSRITNRPLPMAGFLKLPWRVQIDSVTITDARVRIEEFPETAEESGTLTFNAIEATLTHLNNRIQEGNPSKAVLTASGLLMNAGRIHALFQLPLDGSLSYHAQGSVSSMDFEHLNPFLTPLANVRIKSGHLITLTFDFAYNEMTSRGRLDIDYEDLRITGLHTNKQSTNQVKSLVLNAMVKTNRNQSRMSSQRTGTISIERDRKRSIFNLWGKSVLDGLKSSITDRSQKREKK